MRMNNIQRIYYDVEQFYNKNYNKYDLINKFYCRHDNTLTWHKYESHICNGSYINEYQWINNNNQYSFIIGDGHCVQLYYEYNSNDELVKANLAFCPNISENFSESDYVRFDCDVDSHKDYVHTSYHAHFGYNSISRISIYRFPMPIEFLNFIIMQYFNNLLSKDEIGKIKSVKNSCISTLDDLGHLYTTHLRV